MLVQLTSIKVEPDTEMQKFAHCTVAKNSAGIKRPHKPPHGVGAYVDNRRNSGVRMVVVRVN